MFRRPVHVWAALGFYQNLRFGILLWFLESERNGWIGTFLVATAMLDLTVMSRLFRLTGVKSSNSQALFPTLGPSSFVWRRTARRAEMKLEGWS